MPELLTTLGPLSAADLGVILAHEHVAVDLRLPGDRDAPAATESSVEALSDVPVDRIVSRMTPEIERVRSAGVTAIVDATPIGVGRRVDAIAELSRATGFPIAVATGVYREPWIPTWVFDASEDELERWLLEELTDGIGSTGVRAAWIKLSAGDDGMTVVERRLLRAAARAARATGAVIGSHTIRGTTVMDQLDVIESEGYRADRFIWIHAQLEADTDLHERAARRGAWIEYDAIGGWPDDDAYVGHLTRMRSAGFVDQLLLSQDRGWFDLALPDGGSPQPYDYLATTFLPKLRAAGFEADDIDGLTRRNPFRTFSR